MVPREKTKRYRYQGPPLGMRPTALIRKRRKPRPAAKYITRVELAKLALMILGLDVNLIRGIRAKGSCMLYRMFR